MKSENILDALGGVRDEFVAEAAPKKRQKRSPIKWGALAACLVLLAGGAFAALNIGVQRGNAPDLPLVTISAPGGSMGFEGLMYHSADELETANPWNEGVALETLPVYENGCYDASGAGFPRGMNEEEMTQKLQNAAASLGLEITQIKRRTNETKDENGTVTPGAELYALRAETEAGTISVEADGTVTYELPENYALPTEYHFTHSETTREEAEAVIAYLTEKYAAFLGFAEPQTALCGEYNIYGEFIREYYVYDSAQGGADAIINYSLRAAQFCPDDEGHLMLIRLSDALTKAKKLGDYPIISAAEAREKLLAGEYLTSVPYPMPGEEYIAKAELIYRGGRSEKTIMPYYRFYVELPETESAGSALGLKTYGVYYVPAIQSRYIADTAVYDGRFN